MGQAQRNRKELALSITQSLPIEITVNSGELNYVAFIDNCTFVKNSGFKNGVDVTLESGAAASLSSQFFFGSNQDIPVLIFQDWYA